MTIGKLVTRDNDLEAPEGFKTVFVFGFMTVPIDSKLGANRITEVDDGYTLNTQTTEELPKHMELWDVREVCEELFKADGTRDSGALSTADRGLKLISQGNAGDPEMISIVKTLKTQVETMPPLDSMRQVLNAIIMHGEKAHPTAFGGSKKPTTTKKKVVTSK